jgi:type IV pilus assembly protein PilZ
MGLMAMAKNDLERVHGAPTADAAGAERDHRGSASGGAPASSASISASSDRRITARYEVSWAVDCVGPDTFLYASLANISEMGIFVLTTEPLPVGTRLMLSFSPPGHESFKLAGQVAWVNKLRPNGDNPNPGMGIRFINLTLEDRERLVDVIRAICYLRTDAPS